MNAQLSRQVRFPNAVKHMVLMDDLLICKHCVMGEYLKVSREYRPLVSQWICFEEVRYSPMCKCSICGE